MRLSVFLLKDSTHADMAGGDGGGGGSGGGSGSTDVGKYVGVGVFVSSHRAVTADHNLPQSAPVGSTLDAYIPEQHTQLQVQVIERNAELDFAVLGCEGSPRDHLQLYTGEPDNLCGEQLALCSFQLGIHEELPECSTSMGIMRADGVKLSRRKNHLIYTSQTWPGDSGAALVMYDGQLVGLHLAGVNALREKFERMHVEHEERLSAVEDSLELAAQSVATGCIALLSHTFQSAVTGSSCNAE